MKYLYHRLSLVFEIFFNGIYVALFFLVFKKSDSQIWNFIELVRGVQAIDFLVYCVPIVILLSILSQLVLLGSFETLFRKNMFSIILVVPLFLVWGDKEFTFWLAIVHLVSSILSLYEIKNTKKMYLASSKQQGSVFWGFKLQATQLVLLSFFALILVGTILLSLPVSVTDGKAVHWIDSLFMATSAACVTGLSVFSISENYTFVGQLVVLLLIQIGGLGIMTLSSSMTILLGRSLGMKEQIMLQGLLDISSLEDLIAMIISIIKLTLLIEFWGALLLTGAFLLEGQEFSQALFSGVFHAVSAFCNAGFSIYSNGLESYSTNPWVSSIISVLVILGGLGFIVLSEIGAIISGKRKIYEMSLHSKIVLTTSFFLVFLGTFAVFFSEFLNSLDNYNIAEKFLISVFHSVSARTAGFNTIPINLFHTHTIYFIAILMIIGASPGSTGGGMKTTTFAILINSVKATLKGRKQVEMFDRTIPSIMVVKATALSILSLIILSFFLLLMIKVEQKHDFLSVFFEVISAFGTVGLSLGITPELSQMGKLLIALVMFIGRVGPLTLVLAIGQNKETEGNGKVQFPEGRIMIG
jgi:trk system potassium uptake protein TrkH